MTSSQPTRAFASRLPFARRGWVRASALCAWVAVGCSAPPGSEVDGDEVPDYMGPLNGASAGAGGSTAAPQNPNLANPAPANPAPANPATGSANEVPGNLPVASGGSSGAANPGTPAGTGGSAMVGAAGNGGTASTPNNSAGTGGASGSGNTTPEPPVEQPPVVLPGGFFLIDDFEGGRDPAWTESEVGGGAGNFTIDATQGANGSQSSLRVDSNNAFHTMLQFALPQAVRDANEVFGRVFLRLAATPSAAHFIWVEVGNTQNDQHEMRLGHNVGQLQSNHFLNGEQDIRDQSRQLVANTWYCLEFQMANDPDELRVWLDGTETALSTTNYTAGAGAQGNGNAVADFIPPLEAFRIGWELQNGTVFFDDVALANARIGCE
jgi:polysaccharide lyase-like protein